MTFSISWANPGTIGDRLVDRVARVPARVQTKLLVAFLAIVGLLVVLGGIGLLVLSGVNARTEELIKLQRKIAAYHQVQHDTTNQLYNISSALLLQDDQMLDAALRQLSQFGYDLDRMEYVASDEAELLAKVRTDYEAFTGVVTEAVGLIRSGKTEEARNLQRGRIIPLADRLERETNQLVNVAEADMVAAIDATKQTFLASRISVVGFAAAGILLALGLGYTISWSLVAPVRQIEARLRAIAAGDFEGRVEVSNRDELGSLARDVNYTSHELGRLYREIETRNRELSESLEQQTATGNILRVIAASPTDIQPVLNAVVDSAAKLCEAHDSFIALKDGEWMSWKAHYGAIPVADDKWPLGRDTMSGRAVLDRKTVQVDDILQAAGEFPRSHEIAVQEGVRTILAVPLLREEHAIGALVIRRHDVRPFSQKQIDLLTTFANQAVIAIENVRLFEEVQERNRELSEALEQQTATGNILRVIAASPTDIQPVLDVVAGSAARLCEAYDAAIFLRDGDKISVKAHHGPIVTIFEALPIGRDWVSGRAVADRKLVHVHDILEAVDEFPTSHQIALQQGSRTLLAVPLLREGDSIGVITIRRLEVRPFSQKQIDLLTTFADQAVIAIQNARLFEEVQQRNRELTATSDVLRVISRSPTDVQPVFEVIAESAARLCNSEYAYVQRFDGTLVHIMAHYGLTPEEDEATRRPFPMVPSRGYMGGRAILSGAVEQVPDYEQDLEYAHKDVARMMHLRSAVAVPMLRNEKAIGAIVLDRTQPGYYPERQVELLKTFADQAVIAIENVRLFKEVEARTEDLSEALQQQTATAEVLKAISRSTFDLDAVLQALVESAAQLCGAKYSSILMRDGGRLEKKAVSKNMPADAAERLHDLPIDRSSVSGRAVLSGHVEHIPDIFADPEYDTSLPGILTNIRAVLGVPLLGENGVEGVFNLVRPEPGAFTDRQKEIAQSFADQAVIAIKNVRLFKEVEARTEELSEALQQQTATAEVLQVISRSAFDLQTVFDTLVASAARLCEADGAIIFRRQDTVYRIAATHGLTPEFKEYMEQHPVAPDRGSTTGRAVMEGRPVQIEDTLADPEYRWQEAQRIAGWRAILAVPLMRENAPIGAIALLHMTPRPFTPRQVDLVTTFADQAVIAIQNVKLFEEVEARTRELQESLDYQTATSAVLNVISRSPTELQPVLDVIIETAARLCEADGGTIARQQGEGFIRSGEYGLSPEFSELMRREPVEMTRGSVTGRTLVDGKIVHILDASTDPEYTWTDALNLESLRTCLGVPLLRDGVAIGAIALIRRTVRPFTGKQIALVSTFADQAVIAIENVRLFDEVQKRNRELTEALEQQTATSTILRAIAASPTDIQPVLDTVAESAARLCDAYDAVIFLKDGGELALKAHYGPILMDFEARRIGRDWVTGRAFVDRAPVHVHDLRLAADEYPFSHGDSTRHGHRTILAFPLLREGEAIGAIAIRRLEVRPFTQKQIELVSTFADQAVIAIENVRLFDEVQKRNRELSEALEQQTATSTILRAIAASPTDIQPVLDTVAESAAKLCDAYDAAILLRDGESLALKSHYGPIPIDFAKWPIGRDWVTGRAFVDREPVHVEDLVAAAAEFPAGHAMARRLGHRTILAMPLLREEEAIGALVIRRLEVKPFTQKQIDLLKTFADQAVIAIENVRLFEEVQARTRDLSEALQQQTATADVLQVISRATFDLQTVLDTLVESVARLCDADHAWLFRRDGEEYRWAASYGFSREQHEQMKAFLMAQRIVPTRGSVIGRVLLEGAPIQVTNVMTDPDYEWRDLQSVGEYHTAMGVPLLREGVPIGVMTVTRLAERPFTDRQINLMKTFADQAVIAIENVRLFDEVQKRTAELARSVDELKALGEVSQAVNSTLDLKTVLETIVAKAVQLSHTDAGAIYVYSKSADRFRLRATYGMDAELIAAISDQAIGLNTPGMGDAARRREPIQVPDLAESVASPVHQIVLDAGFRSVLVVPLLRPNKIVGSLVVRRRAPGRFSDSTVHLLETFGAQSVLAIQNARLFREIEENGRQLEIASRHKSQFLANMSHELRTPLNSVLGFTEMLADGLYGELPEKAKTTLGRVQANGRHLLGLINDVLDLSKIEAGELKLTIDDYAIGQIVKSVAATTEPLARAKGLTLTVSVKDGLPMGRGDERRLAQVLLNLAGNSVKFTDKGSIEIAADARDGSFHVSVRDTGPGIAPEHQERIFEEFQQVDESSTRQKGGTGLGLAISKRIVEMHGGSISLESAVGAGSTFHITIPIRAEERMKAA